MSSGAASSLDLRTGSCGPLALCRQHPPGLAVVGQMPIPPTHCPRPGTHSPDHQYKPFLLLVQQPQNRGRGGLWSEWCRPGALSARTGKNCEAHAQQGTLGSGLHPPQRLACWVGVISLSLPPAPRFLCTGTLVRESCATWNSGGNEFSEGGGGGLI